VTEATWPRIPRVIVIGSGFGGLGAAIRLKRKGVRDIVILERAESVGGTWRDNTYPGAACDIPAHLYSFSFDLKHDWSTVYPQQPEIREYLEELTDKYDLRSQIEFGADVSEARFDESRAIWQVGTTDGRSFEGEVLIAAPGPLSEPQIPEVPGREEFGGVQFHSAQWDHDVDLAGRRIGVVGTGASSVQIVPQIAAQAAELIVFQRSAPWIIPRLDREYSDRAKKAFRTIPGLQRLYRAGIYWQKELRFAGFRADSPMMKVAESYAQAHMRRQIGEPALQEKLVPDYPMGCKRVCISSDYYPALNRDNVELVTESIERVTRDGILLADGREVPLDVLIWGTGFDVVGVFGGATIRGSDGREIDETWSPHPKAYLGTTIPGFPNLFLVLGPNTGLGHNSMIYMMESQFRYIIDAMRRLIDPDVAYLDVREEALERFVEQVTARNDELVWASGCDSWYLNQGYNFALWPGWTFEYRMKMREFDEESYRIVTQAELGTEREPAGV
jgi:cation diffusion facilitator CzcD-associated flavoprotein CzcO